MLCFNCGEKLSEDAVFCRKCGTKHTVESARAVPEVTEVTPEPVAQSSFANSTYEDPSTPQLIHDTTPEEKRFDPQEKPLQHKKTPDRRKMLIILIIVACVALAIVATAVVIKLLNSNADVGQNEANPPIPSEQAQVATKTPDVQPTSTPQTAATLTMNEAYAQIVETYGFSQELDPLGDYYIYDIIGDVTPELVIWGDSTTKGRFTRDIYGYDTSAGEAFQYTGETEIHGAEKGRDGYCVGNTWSNYGDDYYIYALFDKEILCVQTFYANRDLTEFMIGNEYTDSTVFMNVISRYVSDEIIAWFNEFIEPEPEEIYLTSQEKRNLNIFLSNFVEAFFWEYNPDYTTDNELIQFAWLHNQINNWSRFSYETHGDTTYEVIDGSYITDTIKRFFNREVALASTDYLIYSAENNKFYTPAADGEMYMNFAQVEWMYADGDYYVIGFYIYSLDPDYYDGVDSAYYDPTENWSNDMRNRATAIQWRYAAVQKAIINGKDTYQLYYMGED